ncbi:MAG: hypothetical protein WAT39_17045, partial [Planctomycetota bacterium]
MNAAERLAVPLLLLAGCAASPRWQGDVGEALQAARAAERDLVVYFALPGREASDRMQQSLQDPAVLAALRDGGYHAVINDGQRSADLYLYAAWIGGVEGMGIAVLDGFSRCYAARPGPQDPPELAAFLRRCAAARPQLVALRGALAQPAVAPLDQHALGCLLLELGCRIECEGPL